MGGYGAFVWPAYGVAFGVLALLAAASLRARAVVRRELRAAEAESGRRRRA